MATTTAAAVPSSFHPTSHSSSAPPHMTAMMADSDVIIPPPTALNPLPSLPAALRVDNREQLVSLLEEGSAGGSSTISRRQLLVFEDDALRQLLLRQVLNDPHTSSNSSSSNQRPTTTNNNKKNWQTYNKFNFPKSLEGKIAGTRILEPIRARNGSSRRTASGAHGTTTLSALSVSSSTTPSSTEVSLLQRRTKNNTTNPFDNSNDEGSNKTDPDVLLGDTLNIGQHVDVVTYFVRPWKLETTLLLAQKIPKWKTGQQQMHRVVYVPQINPLVQQVWIDTHLGNLATMSALQLDLFPLESDVWSLEHPLVLRDILEGTPSSLIGACARTMLKIQDLTGPFPRIQALGPLAEDVLQKTLHVAVGEFLQQEEYDYHNNDGGGGNATHPTMTNRSTNHMACILVDRQVDMVTPLATPLTYEGLLDEVVGIETGFLQVPQSSLNPEEEGQASTTTTATPATGSPRVSLGVHAGDSLYAEVRDQHVEQFGLFLQNQAKALQESHANFTNKQQRKDLHQIHQFVKQIPVFTQNLRTLTNHIHLAEAIQAYTQAPAFREQWQTERSLLEGETAYDILEEWIGSHHPIEKVLRGLCLQSLCSGGLKGHKYDQLRQLIVQGYGYEYALKLHYLEQLGWIRRRDTFFEAATFGNLRKSLILIHPEVNTLEPDDVSYVSSGYAPLSVRLVQAAIQGWTKSRADVWKDLPGRCVDVEPTWPPQELSHLLQTQSKPKPSLGEMAKTAFAHTNRKPVLMVFFVGGISYMEIAALRFLSKRQSFPYRIIMITTKIVNGNTMLQQTLEEA
jgi:vacuolar protein sorting-associated protein 33A